ncbi:hypothetical protein [Couchioplanes caeruleus]|uniref:Uncharacterized protein n=2 Tax=Couchioplanes caeruleus TaxID=56438 RepID=A0A1K0FS22_9ACTN|nr:hypothetical protein [Couchioplanes caeruleus]OJF15637.1 hypothetical protein BG844_03255 [Couchioplanes caeruleus subsp. caeruleus]ROP33816.1 hypothetical protein EDD30_6858 [Couchioplanes caeruleus]
MRTPRSSIPTSWFLVAAVAGASALGIAACGRPAEAGAAEGLPPAAVSSLPGAADVVTASQAARSLPAANMSLPRGWKRCVNVTENYSIGYPGTWHTTQIRPEEVCAQFHPDPFTIPAESEYPLTALNAKRVPAPPSRTDTEFEHTLLWEQTTVGARRAVRFETSSTGAGLYLAGTRQYGYVLRLGQSLISVHTTAEPGETRYTAWQTVVDKAVHTLTVAPRSPAHRGCVPIRPDSGFYEAGRVATEELTTPTSRCTTISVSHVVDPANPSDRCQTFRLAFWPLVDGSLTYTEPVTACGARRTVLARNVPDNARYLVLYDVDYIDPEIQTVKFRVWH